MPQNDGGPAFPFTPEFKYDPQYNVNECQTYGGISKREYFAGQALIGILSSHSHPKITPTPHVATRLAYEYADEMIKQHNWFLEEKNTKDETI